MERVVLGLDIGGANLKAATSAGRALSVPFAVWKHPDRLGDELRKLIAHFPEAASIAATMTAELCDCYATKREGVRRIVDDLVAATSLPVRIWSTEGRFVSPKAAKAQHMKVAAANWHALATFACRHVKGNGLLIDIGTTTTDLIPIENGHVSTIGKTDSERLIHRELHYSGWKRTPATTFLSCHAAASEFFATVYDAYMLLGHVAPNPDDSDTADGRPATMINAKARLARMSCGDLENTPDKEIRYTAEVIKELQCFQIRTCIHSLQKRYEALHKQERTLLLSGSGTFLAKLALQAGRRCKYQRLSAFKKTIMLEKLIGKPASDAGPAYSLSVLGAEQA